MRGKEFRELLQNLHHGITPAYAGKRRGGQEHCARPQDHPRICGEKWSNFSRCSFIMGSPPHMRGKGSDGRGARDVEGITPAYAGKSHSRDYRYRCRWDHPRVCGEKAFIEMGAGGPLGSPPRMRGKGTIICLMSCQPGITPAYAGKSRTRRCWTKTTAGSPPRMRGKAPDIQQEKPETGITPAYAGKRPQSGSFLS